MALRKPTVSSTQPDNSGLAVDGDKGAHYADGSCTHTINEMNPWWSVDLQHNYTLARVDLTNRDSWCM